VALRTLYYVAVAARQFKPCGDMVEGRWFPRRGGMAGFAIFRDPRVEVARYLRRVEVGQMATVAGRGCACKTTGVAFGTFGCFVRARQREVCLVVVEGGLQPVVRVVAHRTIRRITSRFVIGRCIVLYLVAV